MQAKSRNTKSPRTVLNSLHKKWEKVGKFCKHNIKTDPSRKTISEDIYKTQKQESTSSQRVEKKKPRTSCFTSEFSQTFKKILSAPQNLPQNLRGRNSSTLQRISLIVKQIKLQVSILNDHRCKGSQWNTYKLISLSHTMINHGLFFGCRNDSIHVNQ